MLYNLYNTIIYMIILHKTVLKYSCFSIFVSMTRDMRILIFRNFTSVSILCW